MQPCTIQLLSLSADDAVSAYLRAVSDFCPFLIPADKAGVLYVAHADLTDETNLGEVQAGVFEHLVVLIEKFRNRRREESDRRKQLLTCFNVVFNVPKELKGGKDLLVQPVWHCKQLFTDVSVVLGMFWKGQGLLTRSGQSVPDPPCPFVAIRSKVEGLDARFFSSNPLLLPQHLGAFDNGQNVHASHFSELPDLTDYASIRASGYYKRVCERWPVPGK